MGPVGEIQDAIAFLRAYGMTGAVLALLFLVAFRVRLRAKEPWQKFEAFRSEVYKLCTVIMLMSATGISALIYHQVTTEELPQMPFETTFKNNAIVSTTFELRKRRHNEVMIKCPETDCQVGIATGEWNLEADHPTVETWQVELDATDKRSGPTGTIAARFNLRLGTHCWHQTALTKRFTYRFLVEDDRQEKTTVWGGIFDPNVAAISENAWGPLDQWPKNIGSCGIEGWLSVLDNPVSN